MIWISFCNALPSQLTGGPNVAALFPYNPPIPPSSSPPLGGPLTISSVPLVLRLVTLVTVHRPPWPTALALAAVWQESGRCPCCWRLHEHGCDGCGSLREWRWEGSNHYWKAKVLTAAPSSHNLGSWTPKVWNLQIFWTKKKFKEHLD